MNDFSGIEKQVTCALQSLIYINYTVLPSSTLLSDL